MNESSVLIQPLQPPLQTWQGSWFSRSPLIKAIVALQHNGVVGCTALHVIRWWHTHCALWVIISSQYYFLWK